jgi:hypothetical protein
MMIAINSKFLDDDRHHKAVFTGVTMPNFPQAHAAARYRWWGGLRRTATSSSIVSPRKAGIHGPDIEWVDEWVPPSRGCR